MIQLNLLPDVKLEYIKARQRKRMVISISIIAAGFFIVIFLALFVFVRFAQQEHLRNLDKDISAKSQELQSKEDLNKILTIQNQLNSLPDLHNKKVVSSRLFDYLTQLTPKKATISEVGIDFSANTLTIKGNADDLGTVNKFADTLKFTGFITNKEDDSVQVCTIGSLEQNKTADQDQQQVVCRAFSEVVLSEFSIGDNLSTDEKPISYDLSFKFDPAIFANIAAKQGKPAVEMKIPKIISTRSVTEKPTDLFAPQPVIEEEGGQE